MFKKKSLTYDSLQQWCCRRRENIMSYNKETKSKRRYMDDVHILKQQKIYKDYNNKNFETAGKFRKRKRCLAEIQNVLFVLIQEDFGVLLH